MRAYGSDSRARWARIATPTSASVSGAGRREADSAWSASTGRPADGHRARDVPAAVSTATHTPLADASNAPPRGGGGGSGLGAAAAPASAGGAGGGGAAGRGGGGTAGDRAAPIPADMARARRGKPRRPRPDNAWSSSGPLLSSSTTLLPAELLSSCTGELGAYWPTSSLYRWVPPSPNVLWKRRHEAHCGPLLGPHCPFVPGMSRYCPQ